MCPWRSSGKAAKLGNDGTLQELLWPVWIQRKLAQIWESMVSNHDECNGILRKVMWANTDFLRRVIGLEVKRSTLKETSECEHCRLFPKGNFLSVISSKRGKKNDNARNLMIGSWCGACGHPSGSASGCVSKLTSGLSCFCPEWKLRQLEVCIQVGHQT